MARKKKLIMARKRIPGELPRKHEVGRPINGWQQYTLYKVEVSMDKNEPIYTALMWSGELEQERMVYYVEGVPKADAQIWHPTKGLKTFKDVYYLKVVKQVENCW